MSNTDGYTGVLSSRKVKLRADLSIPATRATPGKSSRTLACTVPAIPIPMITTCCCNRDPAPCLAAPACRVSLLLVTRHTLPDPRAAASGWSDHPSVRGQGKQDDHDKRQQEGQANEPRQKAQQQPPDLCKSRQPGESRENENEVKHLAHLPSRLSPRCGRDAVVTTQPATNVVT